MKQMFLPLHRIVMNLIDKNILNQRIKSHRGIPISDKIF